MKRRFGLLLPAFLLLAMAAWWLWPRTNPGVQVGSKSFTESVLLGEIITKLAGAGPAAAFHQRELGGTQILWKALLAGEIDLYPEYTGTLTKEILHTAASTDDLRILLRGRGIWMSQPLGFNNTYALAVRPETAERLGLRTISDLRAHPDLRLGFSNEFLNRGDGWPGLKQRYALPHGNVRGLDHDLAYRSLKAGDLDVVDAYSTDADIAFHGLVLLADDLGYFPRYDAVVLARQETLDRWPGLREALQRLEGKLTESGMMALNSQVKLDRQPDQQVAADWLRSKLGIDAEVEAETMWSRFWKHTREHLTLVCISLGAAIVVAVPLGILAFRVPALGRWIPSVVGLVQTIPSLALLVFMIPLLGIGAWPAIVAMFLYSLLPIVRNTYAGLADIPPAIREAAAALGLPAWATLWQIELPLAARSILAGIKTAAVINVGTATIGALIGAGGYGQPILTGIRLSNTSLILQGAIPAALLALLVQGLFAGLEWLVVSPGLRLKPAR